MLLTPMSSRDLFELEKGSGDFVLLECCRRGAEDGASYLFNDAVEIIACDSLRQVPAALERADAALKDGFWLAGCMTYEAAAAYEASLPRRGSDGPLLWLGIYRRPLTLPAGRVEDGQCCQPPGDACKLWNIRLNVDEERYCRDIARIKDYIAAGETYQINYTLEMSFDFQGLSAALYDRLRRAQPVPYAAFMRCSGKYILSLSPELFWKSDCRSIVSRPMKGTAPREVTAHADRMVPELLAADPKSRAENVMIVDLIRNDIGRICRPGSVVVPRLFEIERHPTLWQMTSTVRGELLPGMTFSRIMAALFPCGSVTGAPKIRSMQIIDELERRARGVYTGAIGFMGPHGGAFSVPIRTLVIDRERDSGCMGIGSGIVWDSDTGAEYEECLIKSRFLTVKTEIFHLLETLLWEPGRGYAFLEEHLQRLADSAGYFDFNCPLDEIRSSLDLFCRGCRLRQRVRLLLSPAGEISLQKKALKHLHPPGLPSAVLSPQRVDAANRFLYHKTTLRRLYDDELRRCRRAGHWEAVFCNSRGELTEGAFNNLFLRLDGELLTPPLECGLLPGLLRRHLLQTGQAREQVLYAEDLARADEVLLGNSVRGLIPVQLSRGGAG